MLIIVQAAFAVACFCMSTNALAILEWFRLPWTSSLDHSYFLLKFYYWGVPFKRGFLVFKIGRSLCNCGGVFLVLMAFLIAS